MQPHQQATFVNKAIKDHKTGNDIALSLISSGVTPCVAFEWADEEKRREALRAKALARLGRKRPTGGPGAHGRHIIKTVVRDGTEHCFHATKGWRTYRTQ